MRQAGSPTISPRWTTAFRALKQTSHDRLVPTVPPDKAKTVGMTVQMAERFFAVKQQIEYPEPCSRGVGACPSARCRCSPHANHQDRGRWENAVVLVGLGVSSEDVDLVQQIDVVLTRR